MRVSSALPLAATSFVWQSGAGASILTIVVKATYTLRPGVCLLAPTPDAPQAADAYFSAGAQSSVQAPTDFVPFKRGVDVMVSGHAHAVSGATVRSLVARVAVGTLDKSIAVHGDRSWLPNGTLTRPMPFFRMPLRWERAAGGAVTSNPVGRRAPTAEEGTVAAPNLVPVDFALRKREAEIPPVGFGPLAPHWPARCAHLRRHARTFPHWTWQDQPLPADVEPGYFNAAPVDQQLEALPEPIELLLENLHPEHPRLSAVIEDARPRALVTRGGAAPQELWPRCDTVLVDTDRGVCSLTWRVNLRLAHPREEVSVVVSPTHVPGSRERGVPAPAGARAPRPTLTFASDDEVTRPRAQPPLAKTAPFPASAEVTALTAVPGRSAGLPFGADAPDADESEPAPPAVEDEAASAPRARGLGWLRRPLVLGASAPSLARREVEETFVGERPRAATLPFVSAPAVASPPGPAPRFEIEDPGTFEPGADGASGSLGLPFRAGGDAEVEAEPATDRNPVLELSLAAPAMVPFQPLAAPLATAAPVEVIAPRPVKAVLSLERYARIKAELWGSAELGAVLERHGIDEVEWLVHERRQGSQLAGEGGADLALALMAAFEAARTAGAGAARP